MEIGGTIPPEETAKQDRFWLVNAGALGHHGARNALYRVYRVIFTEPQLQAFLQLSHDRNPLHFDPDYSRRTQFGKVVVYGIASVLAGLGYWARGRRFRLLEIRGEFRKPLYLGEEYSIHCMEEGNRVTLSFQKGGVSQSRMSFKWAEWDASGDWAVGAAPDTIRREPASDPFRGRESWIIDHYPYFIQGAELGRALPEFGLSAGQLPISQLNALLWSSYFVGMECPGRQALFASFDFTFGDEDTRGKGEFTLQDLRCDFDTRFNQVTITGTGTGIPRLEIVAYRRPEPVSYSMEEIRSAVGGGESLRGKTVWITGAGRGFGSVLARTFGAAGADVVVHYQASRDEARKVQQDIESSGGRGFLVQADLCDEVECARMVAEAQRMTGGIDVLVNNASPYIGARQFLEQSGSEFDEFVSRSLSMVTRSLRMCLPLIRPGGAILQISSAYVSSPRPMFTHYLAAKGAIEGLTAGLSKEYPKLAWVLVRPPMMLTDQTNLAFCRDKIQSPIRVANELLERMGGSGFTPGLHEVTFGD